MRLPKSVSSNLRFLVVEVGAQVDNLHSYFEHASNTVGQRILERSGYAHNLKQRIHDGCLREIVRHSDNEAETLSLRAMESISSDLDRIAELCRDCINQTSYLKHWSCLRATDYLPMLSRVADGIARVGPVTTSGNTAKALKIGDVERKLDRDYQRLLRRYISGLKKKCCTEDLICALFVAHAIEQMGDALLNISEAIISAKLGQPVNMERYQAIRESVAKLETENKLADLEIEPVAETRSGSTIAGIAAPDSDDEYLAIFKDGRKRKLKEERDGVASWHEIYPGLAPRILSYKKRGQSAALLIEHLAGQTFEQILLHEPHRQLERALNQLCKTLDSVWRETRSKKKVPAGHMRQLLKRLPEVYAIHPEFRRSTSHIGGLRVASFDTLLQRARKLESRLEAPFSVYIHGDFNVDNIIYDPMEKKINFIDLHRSRHMDYVQDVSVFMVSNYRLQVLDRPLRERIMQVCVAFHGFAADFARRVGDESFELRLALGLARSFASSTRFILDQGLAGDMFMRSRYLLEKVIAADFKKPRSFRIPAEEIFI